MRVCRGAQVFFFVSIKFHICSLNNIKLSSFKQFLFSQVKNKNPLKTPLCICGRSKTQSIQRYDKKDNSD